LEGGQGGKKEEGETGITNFVGSICNGKKGEKSTSCRAQGPSKRIPRDGTGGAMDWERKKAGCGGNLRGVKLDEEEHWGTKGGLKKKLVCRF